MRERWAKGLALATGILVLVLAAVFAAIVNPPDRKPAADADAVAPPAADSGPAPGQVARGQAVFARNNCTGCHSVAGNGSPRSPLDDVGSRLDRDELHDWVVAGDSVRAALPPRAISAKQRHAELPAADMDALLDYLASLRE